MRTAVLRSHIQKASNAGSALRAIGWGALAWAVVAAGFTVLELASGGPPASWWPALSSNLVRWAGWAALTPIIVWAVKALADRPAPTRVIVLLTLGLTLSIGQGVYFATFSSVADTPTIRAETRTPARSGAAPVSIRRRAENGLILNLLIFGLIAGSVQAAIFYRDAQARRLTEATLAGRLAEAELHLLRMQLHPHFLFNALNTVGALMVTDATAARRVLSALADLLRMSLDQSRHQLVPLRDEMIFVSRYLDIQRARFRERLSVTVDVEDDVLDALVPSLLLQPLVENAIRHGVEPFRREGVVRISSRKRGDTLVVSVRDGGPADPVNPPPLYDATQPRRGLGLSNTAQRLRHLYGDAQALRVGPTPDGFVVQVVVPLRRTDVPASASRRV